MTHFKKWLKAAGVRAAKTFFQTFASFITVGLTVSEINCSPDCTLSY